jgi:hypothetical protein
VNFSRLRLGIVLAAAFGIATAAAGLAQPGPSRPAPLMVAQADSANPLATPSAGPRRGRRAPNPNASGSPSPAPSDTPEPPQFTTLDGIWEIELQPVGKRLATYWHLSVNTTGANIIGYFQTGRKKDKYPMTGTFDGRLISMTVTMPDGTTPTFTGYVESFGDMVGLYRTSDKDSGTAFTGQHRKKLKT